MEGWSPDEQCEQVSGVRREVWSRFLFGSSSSSLFLFATRCGPDEFPELYTTVQGIAVERMSRVPRE